MNKYNFETRELCPYRDDWNRGGNIVICGALWYIKEEDGMFLLDTEETRKGTYNRPYNRYRVAQGLPAAILAQGKLLANSSFNYIECCRAYVKATEVLHSPHPAYHMPTVLEDWELSLKKMAIIQHDESGYLDNYARMKVGIFLREMSNPYHILGLKDRMNNRYFYTCHFEDKIEPQIVFSDMPNVAERTEAPMIFAQDLETKSPIRFQTNGFVAAIINLAIFFYWEKRWSEYDFTNFSVVELIKSFFKDQRPIKEIANIRKLSFDLPIEVDAICKTYMEVFLPIMQKVWKMQPEVQLECIEGDNIYTYIYAHEASSLENIQTSELYANLNDNQRHKINSYGKRFLEWMVKAYPITAASQSRVMQAMSKDMPLIQLTIQQNTTITREGEPKKNAGKFRYIISEDEKEIQSVHKRIEKHLDSPAGLRDELLRLQQEGLVALPMERGTDIIREVIRIWGESAPKERSFVTTWGRIKK